MREREREIERERDTYAQIVTHSKLIHIRSLIQTYILIHICTNPHKHVSCYAYLFRFVHLQQMMTTFKKT